MSKTKFTLFSIVCLLIGFLIGKFIYPDLPEVTSSRTTTTTTSIETKIGLPDTSFKYESFEDSDVVYPDLWRESSVGSRQLAVGNRQDSSTLNKTFNLKSGTVKVNVTTYPGVDSADIKVKADIKQTTIVRVDTVYKTTETTITDSIFITTEKENEWAVHVGSFQLWKNEIEVYKYAELSYQHKVWFFNVRASAGFYNRLEESFNGFQPMSKIEFNIPLN